MPPNTRYYFLYGKQTTPCNALNLIDNGTDIYEAQGTEIFSYRMKGYVLVPKIYTISSSYDFQYWLLGGSYLNGTTIVLQDWVIIQKFYVDLKYFDSTLFVLEILLLNFLGDGCTY